MIIYGLKGESKVDDKFKMISDPKNASQIISLIPCLYFWKICGQKKVTPTIIEVHQHGYSILQLEVHHGVPCEDEVELGDGVHH